MWQLDMTPAVMMDSARGYRKTLDAIATSSVCLSATAVKTLRIYVQVLTLIILYRHKICSYVLCYNVSVDHDSRYAHSVPCDVMCYTVCLLYMLCCI